MDGDFYGGEWKITWVYCSHEKRLLNRWENWIFSDRSISKKRTEARTSRYSFNWARQCFGLERPKQHRNFDDNFELAGDTLEQSSRITFSKQKERVNLVLKWNDCRQVHGRSKYPFHQSKSIAVDKEVIGVIGKAAKSKYGGKNIYAYPVSLLLLENKIPGLLYQINV